MPQPARGNVVFAPSPHSMQSMPGGPGGSGVWPHGGNERSMGGAHAPMDAPHSQYDDAYYDSSGRPAPGQTHTLGAHMAAAAVNHRPKQESARRQQGRGGAKPEHMRNYDENFPALG